MLYKLAAFASAVSALSLSQECDIQTLVGKVTPPGATEVTEFEMTVCLDETGTALGGKLESTNNSDLKCTINAGGIQSGFGLKCGEKDVKAKIYPISDGLGGEIEVDGKTATFSVSPKF